jgi:hypothetical protein
MRAPTCRIGLHAGRGRSPGPDARKDARRGEYTGHKMALGQIVVVDVCVREGAAFRQWASSRLAVEFLSPVAGNQQLIRAKGTDPGSS